MKRILVLLALTGASIQAQEPSPGVAVIRTGWEKVRHNVYNYYGPETQRSRDNVYMTEPIGTVRKEGSIWMYQVSGHAMIPAMTRKDAFYALETITTPNWADKN